MTAVALDPSMEGGFLRGFGASLTIIAATMAIVGVVATFYGMVQAAELSTGAGSDDATAGFLAAAGVGAVIFAAGLFLLFIAVPMLIVGLHRRIDSRGRLGTPRGTKRRAFGVGLSLVAALLATYGLVAGVFAGRVLGTEASRYIFGDRGAVSASVVASAFGLILIAGLLAAFGVPLWWAGAQRLNLTERPHRSSPTAVIAYASAALLVLAVGAAAVSEPPQTTGAAATRNEYSAPFSGTLNGVAIMTAGGLHGATHAFNVTLERAVVEVVVDAGTGTLDENPAIIITVEVQGADGSWNEIGQGQGRYTSGQEVALGGALRVHLDLPERADRVEYAGEVHLVPL